MTPLTVAQVNFLALHARWIVYQWQWCLGNTQLRAHVSARTRATIWRDELDDLVARGFMVRSHGESLAITDAGRKAAQQQETV